MFIRSFRIRADKVGEDPVIDFSLRLPAIAQLMARGGFELNQPVTLLVGANGVGKSTLLEALALKAGFSDLGGPLGIDAYASGEQSRLHERLVFRSDPGQAPPLRGYFIRADMHHENLQAWDSPRARAARNNVHSDRILGHRSHGEAAMDILNEHVDGAGLYFFDEPESGLSVIRQMALLTHIHDAVERGAQFIIATHSPILLAIPNAEIIQMDQDGMSRIGFEDSEAVRAMREFLADPTGVVEYLTAEDVEYLGD